MNVSVNIETNRSATDNNTLDHFLCFATSTKRNYGLLACQWNIKNKTQNYIRPSLHTSMIRHDAFADPPCKRKRQCQREPYKTLEILPHRGLLGVVFDAVAIICGTNHSSWKYRMISTCLDFAFSIDKIDIPTVSPPIFVWPMAQNPWYAPHPTVHISKFKAVLSAVGRKQTTPKNHRRMTDEGNAVDLLAVTKQERMLRKAQRRALLSNRAPRSWRMTYNGLRQGVCVHGCRHTLLWWEIMTYSRLYCSKRIRQLS